MELLEPLIAWVVTAISENLLTGVFLASFIETIIPPLPTLLFLPAAGYVASQAGIEPVHAALLGVSGGAGATLSASIIYWLSRQLGRAAILRYLGRVRVSEKKLVRAEAWFERHGAKAVFAGRMVPVFRELVSVPAGLFGMRLLPFVAYTYAGSTLWCTALILVGYYLGEAVIP